MPIPRKPVGGSGSSAIWKLSLVLVFADVEAVHSIVDPSTDWAIARVELWTAGGTT
jgi:hypothetical protein